MKLTPSKQKRAQRFLQLAVIIFVCVVALMELLIIHEMKENFLDSIGKRAVAVAVVSAKELQISSAEVDRLISLSFLDLLNDPVNIAFENRTREVMGYTNVKYIYVMRRLSPEQIKYTVTEDNAVDYGLPVGTKLDTIYLMDSVINLQTRMEDTGGQWYTDWDRYTTLREPEEKAYFSRDVFYTISSDEWGSYVTGYAPLYSTEGDFIGILGADIFLEEYTQTVNSQIGILTAFVVLCVILSIIFLINITRTNKAEETANHFKQKSYYDDMTQMLNRRMLNEHSENYWDEALSKKISLAAMMIDIDNFKHYNDKYGHATGDQIIIGVANAIRSCLREGKDLSFRYGGDEFLVLFFDTDVNVVSTLAERIQNHLNAVTIEPIKESITLSFGISAMAPSRNENLFKLIEQADQSMYKSKRNGGGQLSIFEGNTAEIKPTPPENTPL